MQSGRKVCGKVVNIWLQENSCSMKKINRIHEPTLKRTSMKISALGQAWPECCKPVIVSPLSWCSLGGDKRSEGVGGEPNSQGSLDFSLDPFPFHHPLRQLSLINLQAFFFTLQTSSFSWTFTICFEESIMVPIDSLSMFRLRTVDKTGLYIVFLKSKMLMVKVKAARDLVHMGYMNQAWQGLLLLLSHDQNLHLHLEVWIL